MTVIKTKCQFLLYHYAFVLKDLVTLLVYNSTYFDTSQPNRVKSLLWNEMVVEAKANHLTNTDDPHKSPIASCISDCGDGRRGGSGGSGGSSVYNRIFLLGQNERQILC